MLAATQTLSRISVESMPIPQVSLRQGLLRFRSDRMAWLGELGRERRDIVESSLGGLRLIVITNPELAHQVLVTHSDCFGRAPGIERHARPILGNGVLRSVGEPHLRQRRLLAPRFTPRAITGYAATFLELTRKMLDGWRKLAPRTLYPEMSDLAAAISVRTMFGVEASDDIKAVRSALDLFNRDVYERVRSLIQVPRWLPTPHNREFSRALAGLDELSDRLIRNRRAGGVGDDILTALLAARDEDGQGMDDELLRDQVRTFLIAGYEGMANAFTWAWHLLSQHPEVAQKLAQEVDAIAGDRELQPEDAYRLPYTGQVFKESMRIYPSAYALGRRTTTEVTIGSHRIRRGSLVAINTFGMHRRADYFPQPEEMRPERFGEKPTWPRTAYLPFGVGPHVCIGNHFAMLEGTLVLAELARTVEFHGVSPQLEMEPLVTLRPRGDVPFRLNFRR